MRALRAIAERHRVQIANVFHAGDGNLHPLILYDDRNPEELERAKAANEALLHACIAMGGTITGEHGVGLDKAKNLPLQYGEADLNFMARLRRVLALAWDAELAVVPRGGGNALALGHPPSRLDLVLDLRRLDRVVEYNPDDLTVTVEAGTTMGALAARVGARRQLLPLDPAGVERRTLGGLAATDASGPLRARYGTMRELLLGVRFVQADGVMTWGGAKVVKSVSGYDVPKLMVGALGTLGVLGELTLRLHPEPEFEATWLAVFTDLAAAQAFVARLVDSTV